MVRKKNRVPNCKILKRFSEKFKKNYLIPTMMNEETVMEIQSVQAIFPGEVQPVEESANAISVRCDQNSLLRIQIPAEYPNVPPLMELCAPSLGGEEKRHLLNNLGAICAENGGEPILYLLVERALAFFGERNLGKGGESKDKEGEGEEGNAENLEEDEGDEVVGLDAFYSGLTIEDRKSKFQAHAAKLTSKDQVPDLIAQLKTVGRIARARHNPFAWRLVTSDPLTNRQIEQHDCDDDGENGASTKILRLMVQMKAEGLVVVSRWYGGRKLGTDRFKHICNAARDALINGGFVIDQKR